MQGGKKRMEDDWLEERTSGLTSFPPYLPLPAFVPFFGFGLRFKHMYSTTKQLKLTYFQDRGPWFADHREAPSILLHTRRWSLTDCWAGTCHGHTLSCGMAHSQAECLFAWAPSGSPAAHCWCKGSGCSRGSWCHSALALGAETPHCSFQACLQRDIISGVRLFGGSSVIWYPEILIQGPLLHLY
jgi:hypothetical protein